MCSKVTILGLKFDNLTLAQTLGRVEALIANGSTHRHLTINVHNMVATTRDRGLKDIINESDLVSADGMPIVWISPFVGPSVQERVTGVDLFKGLVYRSAKVGWSVYFLGAEEAVLEKLVGLVHRRWPRLRLVGRRNGYWSEEQEALVVDAIRVAKPDILFIGMTFSKTMHFLEKYQLSIGIPYCLAVGGTFDVLAGKVARAPLWMQDCGLEWLWRILQEPWRLGPRYAMDSIGFLRLLGQELMQTRTGREARVSREGR